MAVVVDERILNGGGGEGGADFKELLCLFRQPCVLLHEDTCGFCTTEKKDACNGKEKRDTHAPHLVRCSQPSSSSQSPGCSVENASVYLASEIPTPRSVFRGSFPSCRILPLRSGYSDQPPRLAPPSFGPPGERNIHTSRKVIQTSSMPS